MHVCAPLSVQRRFWLMLSDPVVYSMSLFIDMCPCVVWSVTIFRGLLLFPHLIGAFAVGDTRLLLSDHTLHFLAEIYLWFFPLFEGWGCGKTCFNDTLWGSVVECIWTGCVRMFYSFTSSYYYSVSLLTYTFLKRELVPLNLLILLFLSYFFTFLFSKNNEDLLWPDGRIKWKSMPRHTAGASCLLSPGAPIDWITLKWTSAFREPCQTLQTACSSDVHSANVFFWGCWLVVFVCWDTPLFLSVCLLAIPLALYVVCFCCGVTKVVFYKCIIQ